MSVRVRFAPSPTGYFHIGSARTALYNWLYAKNHRGKFILRIEDTDEVRSTVHSIRSIINGLKYLGIKWDEGPFIIKNERGDEQILSRGDYGPYFQTLRKNFYSKFADELIKKDLAYLCFCTQEELEEMRKKQMKEKKPIGYDGRCRNLSLKEREKLRAEGRQPVVRFKVPQGKKITFVDLVRGEISFNSDDIKDFVILRATGSPTYNFACVVDDHLMEITDVIRGEDHISNTPKQILIYEAFSWEIPNFAHLPMILDVDGSRLSKRKGARSLLEYEDEGFLKEAMVNYLALLGWGTQDSQNFFEIPELIEKFSLSRVNTSPAIFDENKLLWLNIQHLKKLSAEAIELEKEKIKKLRDIPVLIGFLFADEIDYKEVLEFEKPEILLKLKEILKNISDFKAQEIERKVREFCKEQNLRTKEVFHPLRWALSGRKWGPSLFAMCEFLGKEVCIKRIEKFVEVIGGKK